MKTVYLLLELNCNETVVQILGVYAEQLDAEIAMEEEQKVTRNKLVIEEYSVLCQPNKNK